MPEIILFCIIAITGILNLIIARKKRADDLFKLRYDLYIEAKPAFVINLENEEACFFRDQLDRYLKMSSFRYKFRIIYGIKFTLKLFYGLPELPKRLGRDDPEFKEFILKMEKCYTQDDYEDYFNMVLNLEKPWYWIFLWLKNWVEGRMERKILKNIRT